MGGHAGGRPARSPAGGMTLPPGPGGYALLLSLPASSRLVIGRLGTYRVPAGYYLYLGSALGPGGLRSRLARHLRPDKRLHWHIDYLLRIARIQSIWLLETGDRLECKWAGIAANLPGAALPVPGFGASDCACPAHLVRFPTMPKPAAFANAANLSLGDLTIVQAGGV